MRDKGLLPWRRRDSILPSFFDFGFDDFFDMFSAPVKLDVRETENEYIVEVDLPGYDKKDIEIRCEENLLTISGKQNEVIEEKGDNYIHRERRQGNFSRSVPLPQNINSDAITACFNNGVLTINLPKTTPSKPKGKIIDIE